MVIYQNKLTIDQIRMKLTMDSSKMVLCMDLDNTINPKMRWDIVENFSKERKKEMPNFIQKLALWVEILWMMSSMERVSILGKMDVVMKDNSTKISSMEKEKSICQIISFWKEYGLMDITNKWRLFHNRKKKNSIDHWINWFL